MKNKLDLLTAAILAVIFIAVFGAFFDVISSKEAVVVLVAFGLPLTALNKLSS